MAITTTISDKVSRLLTILGTTSVYYKKIVNIFKTDLIGYWPLWETSGTTVNDISGNTRNGTYSGVELNTKIGIDGNGMPLFDGTNADIIDLSSVVLPVFPKSAGGIFINLQVQDAAAWTDGEMRAAVQGSDGVTKFEISKTSNANQLFAVACGKTIDVGQTYTSTNIMSIVLTWSIANDRITAYYNGYQAGQLSDLTPSGDLGYFIAGAAGGNIWKWSGYMGHFGLVNREITASESLSIAKFGNGIRKFVVIGDSIPEAATSYASLVRDQHNQGRCYLWKYAVGGASIITDEDGDADMAAQVASAATINADIIIIGIGINDTETGEALTTEYLANLTTLKTNHPSSRIFCMSILPTTGFGANEIAKNIRIKAAADAAGCTWWDTNTDAWIVPATDTSDGIHPNAAGHAKIAAQVLARL